MHVSDDLDAILRVTARHVMDALDYQDCVIYLRDADGVFEQRAAWGPKSPDGIEIINPLRLDLGQGVVGHAALTQRVQLVHDTGADARHVSDIGSGGSELAVPIVHAGETLGVIDSEHEQCSWFSEEDADTIRSIAAIVAGMVRSALTAEQLSATVDELHRTQHDLRVAAETDVLTGVGNRRRLEAALHAAAATAERFGVAVIDIDGLKRINDHYGTAEGDRILRSVAQVLGRHFDDPALLLTRCESDEFVVVGSPLPRGFAVKITNALDDIRTLRFPSIEAGFEIKASAGVAYGASVHAWTDASDALTLAKREGGNSLTIFRYDDPGMLRLRGDRAWAQRIERAVIDDTDLHLAAQSVVDVGSGHTAFHEVLLRWQHPDGAWGLPADLLAAAERLNLEHVIDAWVTRTVVKALADGPPTLRLAMNWSVASITSRDMVSLVLDQLSCQSVDPSRLLIEVTEHACIESPNAFNRAVEQLRGRGVGVALDDLGSGWSSLRTLQTTPVDYIKLDGQWVRSARHDELSLIAIRSMIACARALDTKVIAEWVEDESTRALVTGLGVELLQGWLLHRPEPLSALVAPVESHRRG